ncbi:MAG: hypothetical protein RI932_214 [Pseudomonadota bacterium]|jgi:predicted MFS family arabinose efflux permease
MSTTIQLNREKTVLIVLAAIQFAHVMDFMVMMPLGPQLMRIFGLTTSEFGHIVSAYGISSGVAGLLLAPYLDRFDRKNFLKFCLVGLFLGTMLCAVAPSAAVLMLGRCLAGFFGGILGALVQAVISDIFPPERRGSALSRVMLAFSIASVVGVPAGLFFANSFGWHAPFLIVSGLLLALLVATHLYFPSLTGHMNPRVSVAARIKQMLHFFVERNAILGFLATVFIILGQFMVIPFISPYLVNNLGFGEENLPLLYLLGGIASIFTVPLIGKLTDKHTPFKVFPIGLLISIVPLFALTHLTTSNKFYILATTTMFMVCMGGRMVPFMALLTQVVEPQKRGTYLSLTASIQALAQGSAALLAAAIVDTGTQRELIGYGTAGWLAAIFSVMTILLGWQIAKAVGRSSQQTHSKMPSQPQPTSE